MGNINLLMREAIPEDAKALNDVLQVISDGPINVPKAEKLIANIQANEDKYLLVAVDPETEEICGTLFAMAFEDICDQGRPILLIENVAVSMHMQGKGVGKAMFMKIEEWAKQKNCHYGMLVSGNQRVGAHKFYSHIGYEEIKGYKKYFDDV